MTAKPKILMLDIETAPAQAYVWRMFRENISVEQLIKPSRVICWAAKWYGKREIMFQSEWDAPTPYDMLKEIRDLIAEADAVLHYNGDRFDLPRLMGEFAQYGIESPGQVASIDLYKTVKRLGLQSGKLEFAAPYLGVGQKVKHQGFRLWKEVEAGDAKARRTMEKYNRKDTILLEKLYDVLKPYIKNHPYFGERGSTECPACGSNKLQSRGYRRTKAFRIQRLHCQKCGAWSDGAREKTR